MYVCVYIYVYVKTLGFYFFFFTQNTFVSELKHVHLTYRYYANTETYLKAVALKRMPPNLQTVDMLKAGNYLLYSLHFYITFWFNICSVFSESCLK